MIELRCVGQLRVKAQCLSAAEQHAAGLALFGEATIMTSVLALVAYTIINAL